MNTIYAYNCQKPIQFGKRKRQQKEIEYTEPKMRDVYEYGIKKDPITPAMLALCLLGTGIPVGLVVQQRSEYDRPECTAEWDAPKNRVETDEKTKVISDWDYKDKTEDNHKVSDVVYWDDISHRINTQE